MQPRLMAQESIRMANQIAVGTGSLSKEDSRQLVNHWSRTANPAPRRAPALTPDKAGAMGIGVKVYTPAPKGVA